jgi:hypothetical protein
MVADIRGVPNRYVLELGGVDRSEETTSAALGKASRSAQTFAEYRTGGPFALKLAVIQNYATGSIWDLAVNHPGSGVTGVFYPLGSATGMPKFTVTATVSAPTSDAAIGGEGGAVDADSPTIEAEWLLTGSWAQSTV